MKFFTPGFFARYLMLSLNTNLLHRIRNYLSNKDCYFEVYTFHEICIQSVEFIPTVMYRIIFTIRHVLIIRFSAWYLRRAENWPMGLYISIFTRVCTYDSHRFLMAEASGPALAILLCKHVESWTYKLWVRIRIRLFVEEYNESFFMNLSGNIIYNMFIKRIWSWNKKLIWNL